MAQERLFRLAPDAIVITAQHTHHEGWKLSLRVHRGDELWADSYSVVHSHMSTAELLTAVEAELWSQLGG